MGFILSMILFDDLPLDKEILDALRELRINYVFQPIFRADGKTIYARGSSDAST
jgi:hypothetical protein